MNTRQIYGLEFSEADTLVHSAGPRASIKVWFQPDDYFCAELNLYDDSDNRHTLRTGYGSSAKSAVRDLLDQVRRDVCPINTILNTADQNGAHE